MLRYSCSYDHSKVKINIIFVNSAYNSEFCQISLSIAGTYQNAIGKGAFYSHMKTIFLNKMEFVNQNFYPSLPNWNPFSCNA